MSKYKVVRRNNSAVVVDLDTKIVHRGQVFTIPTCSCGYWCSSFRICMDIAKALIEDGRAIWSTNNYHPVHLVQLHPLWSDAIRKCKLEDYNDLPQIIALLGQKNEDSSVPAEVAAKRATTNDVSLPAAILYSSFQVCAQLSIRMLLLLAATP